MADGTPGATTPPSPASPAPVPAPRTGLKAVLFHPIAKLIFKIGFAGGLLTWLVTSGKLDFKSLTKPGNDWSWIALAAAIMLPPNLIAAFRFKILLDGLEMPCTFWRAITWTMIGNFFNVAMPSATGGDVVKAVYVANAYAREKRAMAVLVILLDRILGLFGLFFLALVVCVGGGHRVSDNPHLAQTTSILTILCCGVVVGFYLLASQRLEQSALRKRFVGMLPFGAKIEKLYMGFAGLRRRPGLMAVTLILSMFNHAFLTASMLVLAKGLQMDFVDENLVGGMIVIPLTIFFKVFGFAGGFGVGESASEFLFTHILGAEKSVGASLMFAFNILGFGLSMFGLPFYLLAGRAQPSGEIATSELAETKP
ncbi:MAG: flippase-like domain-containing protein [Planctomycetota bacterium]|nr:flippase-like domain-containing protein [Planctomycetota bacterium]